MGSGHANDLGGSEGVEAVHECDADLDFGGLSMRRHRPPSTDAVVAAERNDATAGNWADPHGRLHASASRGAKRLAISIKQVMAPEERGAPEFNASKIPVCGTLTSRVLACAASSMAAREPSVVLSVLGWRKQPDAT
jgi:hypothetical protein